MPITATITHQALMRALRLSITGFSASPLRRLSTKPISDASASRAPIPANSMRVLLSMSGFLRCQFQQRLTRAGQEGVLVFVLADAQRRAETDRAQQRQGQRTALRHHAVEVGDPYRHQLHGGARLAETVEPALEGQQTLFEIARAFRKHDQRMPLIQCIEHGLQGIGRRVTALTIDQYPMEHAVDDEAAQLALLPVIRAGYRSGPPPQRGWEGGAEQHEIAVAGVVGEVDTLSAGRCTAQPEAARTGEQTRHGGEQESAQIADHRWFLGGIGG